MRKATGRDDVSSWILRECKDQLAVQIHDIIVSSLTEGRVPQEWEIANVVPLQGRPNEL